ncbi:hypothetical protein [Lichenicoccus sp.]|uniref:hypothetical protein n=1 Tax=Lichenicoccus sp. TaxID=2781899 RepID=UPI003D0AFAFB
MSRIRSPVGRDMVAIAPAVIAVLLIILINVNQSVLTLAILLLVLGAVLTLPILLTVLAVPFYFLSRRFGGGWRWTLSWAMVLPVAIGLTPLIGRTRPYVSLVWHYQRYSADIKAARGKAVIWDWGPEVGLAPPEQFLIYDPSDQIARLQADMQPEPDDPTLDSCRGHASRLIGHFYRCN